MIYDLNEIQIDPFDGKEFDICIIGGGIVGITLAMYLKKELNILLLEAGGLNYSEESQEIYQGDHVGFNTNYTLKNRGNRWLGGSSHTWGGRCYPFTSLDFKKRDYVKYSGWPIKKEDLDPYAEEATKIFDLPPLRQQGIYKGWTDILEKSDDYFKGTQFLYSIPPTNFKSKYETELKSRSNINCYVNANLTDMMLKKNLESVNNIEIKNYRNGVFKASAKVFILATSGIENARLLLNFNKQVKKGIGNDNDLVGRFFSDHINSHVGQFIMEDHAENAFLGADRPADEKFVWTTLAPSEKLQRENELVRFEISVRPKLKIFSLILKKFKDKIIDIVCLTEWTKNLAVSINGREFQCKQIDGSVMITEGQEPNPLSRVTLGDNTDKFGLKRAVLDWQFVQKDALTCKTGIMLFAQRFAASGLGRIRVDDWILKKDIKFVDNRYTTGGWHQMGTTRMGSSPKDGVVDSNQKVFGINNLYIGGTSVYTTYGAVNPTFVMVQMTLRLVDHLNKTVCKK